MTASRQVSGFTIVELLIVIVVIGILASVTVVAFNGVQQRAKSVAVEVEQSQMAKKIELHLLGSNTYPTSITDCPTPSAANLCIQPKSGQTLSYYSYVPNAARRYNAGIHSNAEPAYELLLRDQGAFYYYATVEMSHTNEFVQYMDLAPIFDTYGIRPYTISFDIKSANTSTNSNVNIYVQNGSTARYTFGVSVPVTTSYQRRSVTVTPSGPNTSVTQALLAFYGTYGTGNMPTVRNVEIKLAP